jgi:hypothetical protein
VARRAIVSPNKDVVGASVLRAVEPFLVGRGGEGEGQGGECCVAVKMLPAGRGGKRERPSGVWSSASTGSWVRALALDLDLGFSPRSSCSPKVAAPTVPLPPLSRRGARS